ncbi:MAG: hypothetical protein ACRCZW_09980, partial [Lactobacillaceae bacterium]
NNIKQIDFVSIKDYYGEIARLSNVVASIRNFSKKEAERMMCDAFNMGLGQSTALEIVRLCKDRENLN